MAVGMVLAASRDSPTYDETTHVAAGILNVREHDLRWNAEHPPLIKVLAGLATLPASIRIPRDTEGYRTGDQRKLAQSLLYESGNDGVHLMWLARLPMIALTLLFGLVVFGFARDLFGDVGGLIALALYSLCPTVLAHGGVVHADLAVAGFLLATAWFLWRAESGNGRWFAFACVAFGLALATKFTGLFAVPPVLFMAFWTGFGNTQGAYAARVLRGTIRAGLMLAGGLAVLWLCYVTVSPDLRFQTQFYDAADKYTGPVFLVADHLPVPQAYRSGLRFAAAFDRFGQRPAFLFGEAYQGGNPLFYPVVLAVKTPLASMALWVLGLSTVLSRHRRGDVLRATLPIPLFIFGVSVISRTNIGIRHVAVVPIFAAVIAGSLSLRIREKRALGEVLVLLAFTAVSVWRVFPSHIAYANEAFGGPSRAYKLMADSNVDWGQDLTRLRDYLDENPPSEDVWLLYFGTADPKAYGIQARDVTNASREEVHGLVAASVSWLNLAPQRWGWLAKGRDPVARVGDSIFIYSIP